MQCSYFIFTTMSIKLLSFNWKVQIQYSIDNVDIYQLPSLLIIRILIFHMISLFSYCLGQCSEGRVTSHMNMIYTSIELFHIIYSFQVDFLCLYKHITNNLLAERSACTALGRCSRNVVSTINGVFFSLSLLLLLPRFFSLSLFFKVVLGF